MEWAPVVRVEVVKAALPLVSATVALLPFPFLNVAEPVGVPLVEGDRGGESYRGAGVAGSVRHYDGRGGGFAGYESQDRRSCCRELRCQCFRPRLASGSYSQFRRGDLARPSLPGHFGLRGAIL